MKIYSQMQYPCQFSLVLFRFVQCLHIHESILLLS
ncbi:hypothetical protein BS78_01G239100 [Paspalum vaginatum]|nr:hypothetical protein BS78_01G239100 [Paspalum vaginatum]